MLYTHPFKVYNSYVCDTVLYTKLHWYICQVVQQLALILEIYPYIYGKLILTRVIWWGNHSVGKEEFLSTNGARTTESSHAKQ